MAPLNFLIPPFSTIIQNYSKSIYSSHSNNSNNKVSNIESSADEWDNTEENEAEIEEYIFSLLNFIGDKLIFEFLLMPFDLTQN